MKFIQVSVQVVGPADSSQFSIHEGQSAHVKKDVGVAGHVVVDGVIVMEGQLDSERLDAWAQATEELFSGMEYLHYSRADRSPDTTREGWGLRWVENAVHWLRGEISTDLGQAVERLAKRHAELGRIK